MNQSETAVAIQTGGLGKQYRIGRAAAYQTLRETMSGWVRAPLKRLRRSPSPTIWALQDISISIPRGRAVGVIGRNGAGKSTLLKLLTRITAPTRGSIDLFGRVGSLLEVGTGFHHELTGRENVYLNGAILGMRRSEIARKFDEIVAFSGVEKFIDTPVKFYSSGMYMRLAFSVAAHLEPEILLVDEVLAVGDAEFQKKCLGKMEDVAGSGRTVLFVSHQMNAIQQLCQDCLWLDSGRLVELGPARQVVAHYLGSGLTNSEWVASTPNLLDRSYFTPTRFALVDEEMKPLTRDISASQRVGVLIEGYVDNPDSAFSVGFAVYSETGELLYWALHTDAPPDQVPSIVVGSNRLVAWMPPHLLNEGSYRVELHASLHFQEWLSQPGVNAPSLSLDVRGGLSKSPFWIAPRPGLLALHIPFEKLS